jgi:hypothetical protein
MRFVDPYLNLEARWKHLFRALKAVRESEINPALAAELRVAEHKLRLAYTLENYPEEAQA